MHTIGLKYPWEKKIAGESESTRVDVPEPAAIDDTTATSGQGVMRASYTRFFNRPTGLDDASSVLLGIGECDGQIESVSLNHETVDMTGPNSQVEITHRLRQRNELVINIASTVDEPCRLRGRVELAIVGNDS